MKPASAAGPAVTLAYDVAVGYDYLGVGYDASTFSPGASAMTKG